MIISLLNQKGGVGKTTLSVNLAVALAKKNSKVLLVDSDPQGSALDWSESREIPPLFPVIGIPKSTVHKEVEQLKDNYDYIVIDGAPRVTELARSVIMASDIVLIPVQPSPYDVWASSEIVDLIQEAKIYKELLKCAFVINRKIANTAIGRDVKESLEHYEIPVLSTSINQRVAFAESAAQGISVLELARDQQAVKEINNVMNDILELCHD